MMTTKITANRHSAALSAVAASSASERHSGYATLSSQIVFQVSSQNSSGSICNG
jgi:hypothetical protein